MSIFFYIELHNIHFIVCHYELAGRLICFSVCRHEQPICPEKELQKGCEIMTVRVISFPAITLLTLTTTLAATNKVCHVHSMQRRKQMEKLNIYSLTAYFFASVFFN